MKLPSYLASIKNRRRRHKKRGNVLALTIGTLFVVLTTVLVLHQRQGMSRNALDRAEADLRYREARNFAVREHILGDSQPWGLKVSLEVEDVTPETSQPIAANYARNLFQSKDGRWSGLPDLKSDDFAHAHRYLDVTASGWGISGRKSSTYKMVKTEIPGYAAYAPEGQIRVKDVFGWQNPEHEEKDTDSTEAYSGVPALLGARGDIQVEELAYGEAHSVSGEISIESGAGVGFAGSLPLPAYENDFMGSLQSATLSLTGSSSSGNKTGLISNRMGLAEMLGVLTGGNFSGPELLSLRQACNFPTPMIPGASAVVPGVVWEVWLHVPFQPDLGFSTSHDPDLKRLDEIKVEQNEAGQLLEQARIALNKAKQDLDAAQAAYNANPNEDNQEALEEAQEAYDDARQTFDEIEDFLEETSAEAGNIASGKLGSGISALPKTRDEDPAGRKGQWGWNYSEPMAKVFGALESLIKGASLSELAEKVSSNVRVVHYGPEDEAPEFKWNGNTFISRSTWTVPASRTLRYDGDMEIRGDLWLQRGTVMVVNGNLNVTSPVANPSITDSFKPSGRVFFEEGSTLIVNGNFQCEGSSQFGSIMVAAEAGEIHPITSALLVSGDVQIPNGIFTGSTLPDLIAAIGIGNTAGAAAQINQFLSQQAPLLSKLAGPFHLRAPYFARFATTFQVVTVPFPPVVVVTPIPTQKENLLVFAFRAKTMAYTAGLNATLGENLYTQADWWPFGNGVVPFAHNIDLGAALQAQAAAQALEDSAELSPEAIESEVRDFLKIMAERSVSWLISEVEQKLTEEAMRILAPGGFGPIMDTVNDLVDEFKSDEDDIDNFFHGFVEEFQNRMGSHGKELLGDLMQKTNILDSDKYLREYAGLMVHGRNIFVGSDARQVSGLFVAEQDIDIRAELTIGTLMSRHGSIRVEDFLYYPYFNQASLYLPKKVPGSNELERAAFEAYGAAHDSETAVQVGPPPVTHRITMGGYE